MAEIDLPRAKNFSPTVLARNLVLGNLPCVPLSGSNLFGASKTQENS